MENCTGFLINGSVLVSDSDSMRMANPKTGELEELEKINVMFDEGLLKYWIEECGLLDELGINATIW